MSQTRHHQYHPTRMAQLPTPAFGVDHQLSKQTRQVYHQPYLARHVAANRREYWALLATRWNLPTSATAVANFFAKQVQIKNVSTVRRYAFSLHQWHEMREIHPSRTESVFVQQTLRRIQRRGSAVSNEVRASGLVELSLLVATTPPDPAIRLRDRALLLLGFLGAFRRSELSDLVIEDIQFQAKGMRVAFRMSDANQIGDEDLKRSQRQDTSGQRPITVGLWLGRAKRTASRLFLSLTSFGRNNIDQLRNESIRSRFHAVLNRPGLTDLDFSFHSVRAGLITPSYHAGSALDQIRQASGHRDLSNVTAYSRICTGFADSVARPIVDPPSQQPPILIQTSTGSSSSSAHGTYHHYEAHLLVTLTIDQSTTRQADALGPVTRLQRKNRLLRSALNRPHLKSPQQQAPHASLIQQLLGASDPKQSLHVVHHFFAATPLE